MPVFPQSSRSSGRTPGREEVGRIDPELTTDDSSFDDVPDRVRENRNAPPKQKLREVEPGDEDDALHTSDEDTDKVDDRDVARQMADEANGLDRDEDDEPADPDADDAPAAGDKKPAKSDPKLDALVAAGGVLGMDAGDIKDMCESIGYEKTIKLIERQSERLSESGDAPAAPAPRQEPAPQQERPAAPANKALKAVTKITDEQLTVLKEQYPELETIFVGFNALVDNHQAIGGETQQMRQFTDRAMQAQHRAYLTQIDSAMDSLATGKFEKVYGKSANVKDNSPQDLARAELLKKAQIFIRRGVPLTKAISDAHTLMHLNEILADANSTSGKKIEERIHKRSRQLDPSPSAAPINKHKARSTKEAIRTADAAALASIEKQFGRK